MKRKYLFFVLVFIMIISIYGFAAGDAKTEFQELLGKLKEEGLISESAGSIITLGNFEDDYAMMGYYTWFPLMDAENFVLSSKLSWSSGHDHPNSGQAGCGFIFGADPATGYHDLASVRMDGTVYITGVNYTGILKYGNNYFGPPSIEGTVAFTLVVNGTSVYVYLNGTRIMERQSVYGYGNGIGPAVLSGTNWSFGNRCRWEDTYLYTF